MFNDFKKAHRYSWLTSPLLFAIIFTSIFCIIRTDIFNPYRINARLLPKEKEAHNFFEDLDSDSYSESISFLKATEKQSYAVEINKEKYLLKDDHVIHIITSYVNDCNNDGYEEIYFFSNKKDSIFLTSLDYKTKEYHYKYLGKFKLSYYGSKYADFITAFDSDGDGNKEIFFFINSKTDGFLRCIVKYDIKKDKITRTARFNTLLIGVYAQINNNKLNIVASTWGLRNAKSIIKRTGEIYKKGAMYVFDGNLNQKFKPIKYEGENKAIGCLNVYHKGSNYICTFIDCVSNLSISFRNKTLIEIFDYQGKKVNSRFIDKDIFILKKAYFTMRSGESSFIYITQRTGGLVKLNFNLKSKTEHNIEGLETPILGFSLDMDNDGKKELFFHDNSRENNVIVKEDFSMPVYFKRPKPYDKIDFVCSIGNLKGNKHNSIAHSYTYVINENIYLESKYLSLFLDYYKDKDAWYKYIYIFIVFVLSYAFVWWLRFFISRSIEKKYRIENKIAELRYQNIRNQMSPHFTLNAMNSIASLIYKEEREKAYDYLAKLAKLMRVSLLDANISERPIIDELDFVKNYLELQKLRFKDKFDYEIEVEDAICYKVEIMPYMIQTFVENAIKYGIANLDKRGFIKIDVNKYKSGVEILIQDNGIGRKNASKLIQSHSTGKGIKLIKDYMNILNKKDKREMSIDIIDLEENGKVLGTKVRLYIDVLKIGI